MVPTSSFWGWFTSQGRLKNHWARALREKKPERGLDKLRQVMKTLTKETARYPHLLLPFLDTFFDAKRIRSLTDRDFRSVMEAGRVLSNNPSPPVKPGEIWFRVVKAYDARQEKLKALNVLRDIYRDRTSGKETKARCCQEMVRYRAKGDDDLRIYIDYLRGLKDYHGEKEIIEILTNICQVDFESERVLVKRAGEVAAILDNHKINIPGIMTAMGLNALIVEKNCFEAVRCFKAAVNEDRTAVVPLLGVIAALIQNGDYSQVADVEINDSAGQVVRDLVTLGRTLDWLQSRTEKGTVPAGTGFLEGSGLQKYAGDIFHAALGRLYLLEGNAKKAAEILMPFAERHAGEPAWRYYTSWAAVLTGNRQALTDQYNAVGKWSGRWTLACHVQDFDPVLAENKNVMGVFQRAPSVYKSIIAVRNAMAGLADVPELKWKQDAGSIEEDIETLRTVLGYAFIKKDIERMKSAAAKPLFLRLPLADQLMWNGLQMMINGDRMQGLSLLEESAVKYGYRRAALIMAVYGLERKQSDNTSHFLELSDNGRTDIKMELIRAYHDACNGKTLAASERLEKSDAWEGPSVIYALGNIYLYLAGEARENGKIDRSQLYMEQASGAFKKVLKKDSGRISSDCRILAQCTEFVASPEEMKEPLARFWSEVKSISASHRDPWVTWNIILARMCNDDPPEASVCEEALDLLEGAGNIPDSASLELARAAALACINAKRSDQSEVFLKLLAYLSTGSDHPQIRQLNRLGMTAITLGRYQQASGEEREHVHKHMNRVLNKDPWNTGMTLLSVYAYLKKNNKSEALSALRQAKMEDNFTRQLCASLICLLGGDAPSADILTEEGVDIAEESVPAHRLLQAMMKFASNKQDEGYDKLLSVMNSQPDILNNIINVYKFLPLLCAYSTKRGFVPTQLAEWVHSMAGGLKDDTKALIVSRCAAAIGEKETTCRLYERLLETNKDSESTVRREYIEYLCHLAVSNHKPENGLETVVNLRKAAEYAAEEQ
ncbi:MAG: hypothetical protein J7K35_06585 [Syntrophobacterales bacterium]|nr:hypothetical protein [Syntrophobacterales bacterium]